MDISYRPARPEDLEEGERVCFQAGNELRVRHGGQAAPAPPSTAFPKFCLAEDPNGLRVAESDDGIVGFGFGWMTGKFWFLSQLFVRPETQAKGIGQALLSRTLQQAERNGADNRALEINSREWAAATARGVWNIAGPIFGARPRTIGRTRVAVPAASWMIVVRGDRAIAVIIPNSMRFSGAHRWQDFVVPIAEVERQAGMGINLPAGVAHDTKEPAWPVDHGPWTVEHQAACAHNR